MCAYIFTHVWMEPFAGVRSPISTWPNLKISVLCAKHSMHCWKASKNVGYTVINDGLRMRWSLYHISVHRFVNKYLEASVSEV